MLVVRKIRHHNKQCTTTMMIPRKYVHHNSTAYSVTHCPHAGTARPTDTRISLECMYACIYVTLAVGHARAHAWINRPTKSTGKSSGQVHFLHFPMQSSIILVFSSPTPRSWILVTGTSLCHDLAMQDRCTAHIG